MVATRHGYDTSGAGLSDANSCDLVASEVSWVILEELPYMFCRIKDELITIYVQ